MRQTLIFKRTATRILPGAFIIIGIFAAAAPAPLAKLRQTGKTLVLRPVTVRNVDYASDGRCFAIPNFITAGSVALFEVTEQGEVVNAPARYSEKDFIRSAGLFYLRKKKPSDPYMAFISLPELLTGYSVDFSDEGLLLAVAGGGTVTIHDGKNNWEKIKSISVGASITRAVFSPDGSRLAVISDGKLHIFRTPQYALECTVEPSSGHRFCDVAFSMDNARCALFEFRPVMLDFGGRIRIFYAKDGSHDRDLPWFDPRPASEPGERLPLLSFSPGDSLLAVSLPATLTGKVLLMKSNDGTIVKEFKGFCHAFSPDGTLFVAQNSVYSLHDWSSKGKLPNSTIACCFSPTQRVIIAVTRDAVRRFSIEE